jgi:hypothetical protein
MSLLDQAASLPDISDAAHDRASAAAWQGLSLALDVGPGAVRADWARNPGAALRDLAAARGLDGVDGQVDAIVAEALGALPDALAQRVMIAYLGFAYHDAATLALIQQNDLAETSPVRIDRISPMDWQDEPDNLGLARRLKGRRCTSSGPFSAAPIGSMIT